MQSEPDQRDRLAAIRVISPKTGDLLYAEFVDGNNPAGYDYAPAAINFRELYNVTEDYHMLHNVFSVLHGGIWRRRGDAGGLHGCVENGGCAGLWFWIAQLLAFKLLAVHKLCVLWI